MTSKADGKIEIKEMKESEEGKEKSSQPLLGHEEQAALMAQLNELEQKNAQYWDRILRMQADMDNAMRRTERDVTHAHKFALEKFVSELLPVIDNLERAIAVSQETLADVSAIIEGVQLTLKLLYDLLNKSGIQQVNPIDQAFNPVFHEAVSIQMDETKPSGRVLSVLQKGYLLNERLIRPALVIVSK